MTPDTAKTDGADSQRSHRALIVYNPGSGSAGDAALLAVQSALGAAGWSSEVYRVSESSFDDIKSTVIAARDGVELVIAAGGDGTIGIVGSSLVGSDVPLGIVPLGTANVVAQELGIPMGAAAAALLVGEHDLRQIDAMLIDGRHYFLQAGIGIDSLMMRDTTSERKRKLGFLAYIVTLLEKIRGYHAPLFRIEVDGRLYQARGWEALVANVGTLGSPMLHWGDDIQPGDGVLNVVVVRTRRPLDYLPVLWRLVTRTGRNSPALTVYESHQSITISVDRPMPVQADGDVIEAKELRVDVVAGAVRIVVPRAGTELAVKIAAKLPAGTRPGVFRWIERLIGRRTKAESAP